MITEKAYAICLLEILKEYSDEEHILTTKGIIGKMNSIYGVSPDRRTIYSAVALLIELEYDISVYEENGKGYYLRSREYEMSETLMLTEAVYAASFLPAKQSEQLIDKIQRQQSRYFRNKYKHLRLVKDEYKSDNRQVFWNIEQLDEAISAGRKVQFFYVKYNMEKQLVPKRDTPSLVNPYELLYTNDHFYLVGSQGEYEPTLYRLDRMRDLQITDEPVRKQNIHKDEFEKAVYAFSGKPETVTFCCDEFLISDVIDKFGKDIFVSTCGEGKVAVTLTVAPQGMKFWALQYLPYVEVISPAWLREEIIESVKANPYEIFTEYKLDMADEAAESDDTRYSAEEVFGRVRKRIDGK